VNSYVKNYREALAQKGLVDPRPDDILTWEEGEWARQNAPDLFEKYPDFSDEWSQLREYNAPDLGEEFGRAFKRAGIGLGSTALGGAALLTGSDALKRKAAALSMQAGDPELASTIPTLEDIDSPRSAVRYATSKVGEVVPSLGEAVALSLVGGAIGSAVEPGAGTVAGAATGAVEGLIGRGIIRKAIQSLVKKGITEEAVISGLRKGAPEVIEAVTKNAKSIAGVRAGTVTAGLNSFLLNAGDVYSENDDRGVAAGLGLISAIPDTVLPALVIRKIFPGVSLKVGKEAARELVGSNALKVAKAAGVVGFEGGTESFQEAVNIVARNLKEGVDPFTVTDADKIRIREAGITGAVGGALAAPAVVMERTQEEIDATPPPAPVAPAPAAPLVPPPTPEIVVPVSPRLRIAAMSPEQQVTRLAELETNTARSPDEEAEYQLLRQLAPRTEAEAPAPPRVAPPVNPFAGLNETVDTTGVTTPVDALLNDFVPAPEAAPLSPLPPPADVAGSETPIPGVDVAPVAATIQPVDIGDRSGRPTGAAEEAIVDQMRKDAGLGERKPVIAFDAKDGIGSVPFNQEVAYRGFQKTMTPDEFIGLAKKKSGEESSGAIERLIRGGKAVGPPFLNVEWLPEQGAWKVVGHEGRNRSEAIKRIAADTAMPVHLFPKGMRAKDITPEMVAAPIIAEGTALPAPRTSPKQRPNDALPVIEKLSIRKDGNAYVVKDFSFLESPELALVEPPKTAETIPSGELPAGTVSVVVDQRFSGNPRPSYAITPDGSVYEYESGFSGISPWRLKYVKDGGNMSIRPASKEQRLNDTPPDLSTLSESQLASLAATLGIDPNKMSGDRLRARIESNARPEAIAEALGQAPAMRTTVDRSISPNNPLLDRTSPASIVFTDASPSAADAQVIADFQVSLSEPDVGGGSVVTLRAVEPNPSGARSPSGVVTEGGGRILQSGTAATQTIRMGLVRPGLERAFGKRIIFVRPSAPVEWGALTSSQHANTILVNADSRAPFMALFGHELGHNLRAQRPDLHARLSAFILKASPVSQDYANRKIAQKYSEAKIAEEWVSDVIGQRFDEPAFWQMLKQEMEDAGQGNKFAALVKQVQAWIAEVTRKIKSYLEPSARALMLGDIDAIRRAVASTTAEYVTGGPYADDPTGSLAPRTSTEPTNPAVQAQRTKEFQAVMGRLVANGANVQAMSRELLAQQTGEAIQQQLAALQARLQAATTAPQRNELQKQIALRQERLAEVAQMRGVTFNPYHIAVAMDDVMNASLDNLVTLLHEAAESLTMRLPPAQQGAVFRAVEATTAQMQAKMEAAARNTGATVANVPVPSELLAETMAQALAAEGIQDSPSLAQAIVRWIKEIYYRVAMAAQRAFGAEPNPELALGWYENQLRRELGGDYSYALSNLLDRFLPQPNRNFAAKFSGATGTPGGMVDFFDPVTQSLRQPWVEPLSDEALAWNMKFQTSGVNPGESESIPAEEAVARQHAASYSEQVAWLNKLHDDIAPAMDMGEFLGLVSRGEKSPQELLDALESRMPGASSAKIGGERMTDAMNKWAAHQTLEFMKGVQGKHLSRIASMQETVAETEERLVEHATELNRIEPDVRNAELHEGELRKKAREIIDGLLKSMKDGYKTSAKLGALEEMLRNDENISDRDPLPQFYAQVFANLLKADVPLFDYVEALAMLDLPVEYMTPQQIWKAIRDNADTSELLRELSRNKPLAMTISVLAKNNARQLDQIQLRRADAETFLDVRRELEGIRNATEAQLREMLKAIDEKNTAKGLRQRLRTAYLKERRKLKRASDSIAVTEERIALLEKAKPAVEQKLNEMQQAIGGVFSDWAPRDEAELIVMRRRDDGTFQKTSRVLKFRADGAAEDSDGIYNDLAQNQQWLRANVKRAGQKEYEQVKHQTDAMNLLDLSRAYPAYNYGKIMGFIDAFVRPLQAIAKQAGHSSGNRIVQQFNKYEFINRSGQKALFPQSYEWGSLMGKLMDSAGIKDVGQFRSQIYNPVMFYLGVNPGFDKSPEAIREAARIVRDRLAKPPAANFNERLGAFLVKTKEINDELQGTALNNNVLVWDEKLGELRKALPRGFITGMRTMNDGVVVTLIHDMEKAGWTLDFDEDAKAKSRKVVTRSTTFDALNPKNANSPEERAEYFAQLENTEALRAALKPYFTPGILERWLLPFINKPGEPVFSHDGQDISQIDLQNAWAKSGGDVVTWIDNLGQMVDVKAEEGVSNAAAFRADMIRQLNDLFGWESKFAYEAEQTPDVFDNSGSKLHVMMDARVNDLMPEEHVNFVMYDPKSVQQLLGQVAFHGAFGRNGEALRNNLNELGSVSAAKAKAFNGLLSTTVEGKKREAKERGFDYDELKRSMKHYHDVQELKGEIESAFGVKNIYGPLYDARAGMELLGFMVGQVVDQPKTAALNFLSIGMRPFAQHSFSPKALKATGLAYAELAKSSFTSMLRDLGIDLVRESDYAKDTGEVEGAAFRRLPYGTILTGDMGKNGSFQDSISSRFLIRPLRTLRAIQRKGVGPGLAVIPGLGTMQRFTTEAAKANAIGAAFQLQQIINNGIKYFSSHPEDLANPAFRFDSTKLKLRADRGMYEWFKNKTVEYNMGSIEKIVRDAISRQAAGERTITREMVEQLAQMNAQELDGASSINTAPAGLAQNKALNMALPLLRWPLWMMHAAHEGLATAEGRADFKSMMRGIGRLAAWNLPLGLAFTFLIDEYDEKILKKKNAMPEVSKLGAIPVLGVPLALATTPRTIPQEMIGIGQRMIRTGNIYGLGADAAGLIITPFDPSSGQRQFSLDQRVLVMSQFLNFTQAIRNWMSQGVPTWGSVYRPMVASIGGNGALNTIDIINNVLGLDNAESRLTTRINAARWINTAAKELGYDVRKASGFGAPTPMSVWTREMQLAAMANSRADFMEAYRKALQAAREKVAGDSGVSPENREREALARVLASWRTRDPFSGLATVATPDQKSAILRIMNEQGRADVQDAMRLYDTYTRLIKPSDMDRYLERRMRVVDPAAQMEAMRRRAAGAMMGQ